MTHPTIDKSAYQWDKAPKWANWAAFTKELELIYFDYKPEAASEEWEIHGMYIVYNKIKLPQIPTQWKWQETLISREECEDQNKTVLLAPLLEKAVEPQDKLSMSFHSFTIRAVYNRALHKDGFRIIGLWGDEEKFEGNRIGPFFETLEHCEQELDICLKTIKFPILITEAEKYFEQMIKQKKVEPNDQDYFPTSPVVEVSAKQFEQMDDERRASAIEQLKKNSPVMERSNPGVVDVERLQRELSRRNKEQSEQNTAIKVVEVKLDELTNLVKQLYEFMSKKNESDLIEKICQDAPDWATYHAFDENATGAYYEHEPKQTIMAGRNIWNIANSRDRLRMSDFKKPTTMPWDKSLIKVVKNR